MAPGDLVMKSFWSLFMAPGDLVMKSFGECECEFAGGGRRTEEQQDNWYSKGLIQSQK